MRVLVAEDDGASRRMLEGALVKWGYDVDVAPDGDQAWRILRSADRPPLAVLNWMMPGMSGLEICRNARADPAVRSTHIILLTARESTDEIVEGLDAGADDYMVKPFDAAELRARVRVGARVVGLQAQLNRRIGELEDALSHVTLLQGLLPICSYCKKIRDDQDYWHEVETYVSRRSAAEFSHSICPDCYDTSVRPMMQRG
jgi:DNA-binding response OmpR family regulator